MRLSLPSISDIIIDSGPLYALFDQSDTYHLASVTWLQRSRRSRLVANACVLTEVTCLLSSRGLRTAIDPFLAWASEALEIDTELSGDLPRIRAILAKYADLPADFADASLVALAERRNCFSVASVDSDFTIYRGACRRAFRNVLTTG